MVLSLLRKCRAGSAFEASCVRRVSIKCSKQSLQLIGGRAPFALPRRANRIHAYKGCSGETDGFRVNFGAVHRRCVRKHRANEREVDREGRWSGPFITALAAILDKPLQREVANGVFAKLALQSRKRRVVGSAKLYAVGPEVVDMLVHQLAERCVGSGLSTNGIFALVDATFSFADSGIRIRFHDKGLAKNVTFTSYLISPLATRPPVN